MHLGIGGLGEGVEIGVGASATVFRARQTDLDREVAVKLLTATDDAFVRRFNREAKTLGKLSEHKGIVTVYDTGVNESGQPYLIMELCQDSLLGWLERAGPPDPIEACRHLARVTGAVAEAHEAGVVHRDIKPANILVSADGRAMITDFGIATTEVGETNSVGFTASYVAPETINGRMAGPPGDVYSLGATLFHLVSGETAFTDPDQVTSIAALAQRITTEPVPNLRPRGVPDAICEVIEWAMAKDPDDRPTAAQLQQALEAVAAGDRARVGIPPGGLAPDQAGSGPDGGQASVRETADIAPDQAQSFDDATTATAATTMVTGVSKGHSGQTINPPQPPGQPGAAGGVLDAGPPPPPSSAGQPAGGQVAAGQPGDGSVDKGLFPTTGGISLPATAPAEYEGPAAHRRELFVLPDSRMLAKFFTAAAVILGLVVVGIGVLSLVNRGGSDDTGVAAGTEDEQLAAPDVEQGNAQSGSFDPAGPPELRPNLGNAVPRIPTPEVTGLGEIRAEQELLSAGLRVNTVYRENASVPVGQVIGQDPAAGSQVLEDSLVTIFVSRRIEDPPIPVPALGGLSVTEATARLEAEGLSVEAQRSIYHDSLVAGLVVGADPPAETLVNANSSVILFVSLGQPVVPDLAGMTAEAATAALEALALMVEVVNGPGSGELGTVDSSSPVAGTSVLIDSVVQITVIDEVVVTCQLDVATLAGQTEAEAEAAIAAVTGCSVGPAAPQEFSETVASGNVISASIDGQAVRLVISKGPAPDPCDTAALATLVAGLSGVTPATAVADIEAIGCSVGPDLPPEISASVAVGTIVRGEITGSTVRFVISADSCTIPAVVELTVGAAKQAIAAAGCTGTVSAGAAADTAIVGGVTPTAGTVIIVDDPITLSAVVPVPVVPDVVGMSQADAVGAITAAGLTPNVVTTPLPVESANIGLVIAQNPVSGTPAGSNDTVTITVGVEEVPPGP